MRVHDVDDVPARLFVVDDDVAVRESLRVLLEAYGMSVEVFPSAEAFLAAYEAHDRGCLLLDQHLQNAKTGLDFLTSEIKTKIDLPVILMTGRGDSELRARALQAGAAGYLEKPVDEDLLLATIEASIAKHR